MCVYICMCIYIYTHTIAYTHTRTHTRTHTYIRIHVFIYIYIHVYILYAGTTSQRPSSKIDTVNWSSYQPPEVVTSLFQDQIENTSRDYEISENDPITPSAAPSPYVSDLHNSMHADVCIICA